MITTKTNKILPQAIDQLVQYFKQFPAVGEKSAFRMVMFMLSQTPDFHLHFGELIRQLPERVGLCSQCFNIAKKDSLCSVCSDPTRDRSRVCVVQSIPDLLAVNSSGEYRGLFFVLHGLLSPLKGIGSEQLHVKELKEFITKNNVNEMIVATDYSVEGDATALYLAKILEKYNVSISRIAAGIPSGGSIEYLDSRTIQNALRERKSFGYS